MTYSIDFHFYDKKEFTNGWQLLWMEKYNQDEAIKQRTKLYRRLVQGLKPQMWQMAVNLVKRMFSIIRLHHFIKI